MIEVFLPNDGGRDFLRSAVDAGYGMEPQLIHPRVARAVSAELEEANLLVEGLELASISKISGPDFPMTNLVYNGLREAIQAVDPTQVFDPIPFFGVRIFESHEPSTTIHRNHPAIGPWTVGITLRGVAPFNVYSQDQLAEGTVTPLEGDGNDPTPLASMDTRPGSAWTLYTANAQVPHSGGIVESKSPRELLLFYNTKD